MPPRAVNAQNVGLGLQAWWGSLPPISRTLALLMVIFTVAGNYGWISPASIALLWQPVIKKFEVWRLLTNFLFLGKLSFNFVIRIIWVIQHSCPLESQTFQFEPADYLWMLCICGCLCIASTPFVGFVFNGIPLIMAIIYVWSRNFPEGQVSLYGLIKIQSFYLPWAFVGISMLMGQSIVPDLTGIAVGHAYYFLADVYPLQSGRRLITTPAILKNWLADIGIRGIAPPSREAQRTGAPHGFQSFQGTGRRLQD